ncbi:MAG: hypothetical protein MSJ26_05075 [Oscillospiraceae bacterium]|nr:hypothetical protein [Oscillospiraceae bacterium]
MRGHHENYYLLPDGRGYYTVLERIYDSAQLEKVGGDLYYCFKEYYFDGGNYFTIDRISERLIPCEMPLSDGIKTVIGK